MNIVSLDPSISATLGSLGLGPNLVGVTDRCGARAEFADKAVVAEYRAHGSSVVGDSGALSLLSSTLDITKLSPLEPDVILGLWRPAEHDSNLVSQLQESLSVKLSRDIKLRLYLVRTLDEVYLFFEKLGKDIGLGAAGLGLAQKLKAQAMDWADNFYNRMKHKKVSFVSAVSPLSLAGHWVPDMIKLLSAVSHNSNGLAADRQISWDDIVSFRPDVLVVAPRESSLEEARKTFLEFEAFPGWEDLPAVKRGEVIFTGGREQFYEASPRLRDSLGILASAIAGFESGYITERDSFFRLRWLEMHRHSL